MSPRQSTNLFPPSQIQSALALASSSTQADLNELLGMLEDNPNLLFERGNITTRGGIMSLNTTIYEFFLRENDPVGANAVGTYFAKLRNGEAERSAQYENYRMHFLALKENILAKKSAYDVTGLMQLILTSSSEELMGDRVKRALDDFKNAIKLPKKDSGLHYDHYTTLLQVFDIVNAHIDNVLYADINHDQLRFIWREIIKVLQLAGMPAIDRFDFAYGLEENAPRTVVIGDEATRTFPNTKMNSSYEEMNEAIFGTHTGDEAYKWAFYSSGCWKRHILENIEACLNLAPTPALTASLA